MSAAIRLLGRLGETRPVALVIDDLHRADAATLALLLELASAPSLRVLTIATYRDHEVVAAGPFADALAALHRHPDVHRLHLEGLDLAELGELVAALAGHDLAPDATVQQLLRGLQDETKGNPFFALEILRYLAGTGDLVQHASGRWEPRIGLDLAELPDSIREVVATRVAGVGRDVASTLAVAAHIGNEFGLTMLARVLDRDEDAVIEVLEKAETAGLIAFVDGDRCVFSHALIANALAQSLSEIRRPALHRRIAEQLECAEIDVRDADALAGHWLGARATTRPSARCSTPSSPVTAPSPVSPPTTPCPGTGPRSTSSATATRDGA